MYWDIAYRQRGIDNSVISNVFKLGLGSSAELTAGRSRLSAIQVAAETTTAASGAQVDDFDFDEMKIELTNGENGDVLFGVCLPLGAKNDGQGFGWASMPRFYEFGSARILFPDGIWVKAMTGNTGTKPDPARVAISIFYEGA